MHNVRPRWSQRSLRRGILPILVLILALPAAGIASAALFDSSLVPWFVTGGASDTASIGGGYSLTGAAGVPGAHLIPISGGDHTLYAGYVPAQAATTGASGTIWLPIVAGEESE